MFSLFKEIDYTGDIGKWNWAVVKEHCTTKTLS